MSDSSYCQVHRRRNLLDVVDEEWMMDCLSDDDIELPVDGDSISTRTPQHPPQKQWNELGLDQLSRES